MSDHYTAEAIEVLSGLEPVQRRPGMYTDTTRPNHLAQEVIDNSVDEVIAGFAGRIVVTLYDDYSIEVEDDGRGMPVDAHPQLGHFKFIFNQLCNVFCYCFNEGKAIGFNVGGDALT